MPPKGASSAFNSRYAHSSYNASHGFSSAAVYPLPQANSKGYGWLLEVESDDEGEQRPLLEELDIDFMDIFFKIKAILLPYQLKPLDGKLTEPDFWGPFFIVLVYSSLLLWGQFRVVSWVFTLWLMGSFVIYFLSKVLGGGEGGYAATLAVTGYSLIPLVQPQCLRPKAAVAASLCSLCLCLCVSVCVSWSLFSASVFSSNLSLP